MLIIGLVYAVVVRKSRSGGFEPQPSCFVGSTLIPYLQYCNFGVHFRLSMTEMVISHQSFFDVLIVCFTVCGIESRFCVLKH